jgi:hypothetical protein
VLQPTFLVGRLLQLPFAVVAYVAARGLLRVAGDAALALSAISVGRVGRWALGFSITPPSGRSFTALILDQANG